MNFQTRIKDHYKRKGYTVLKVIGLSANGYPDLLAIKKGVSIWIESKEANDTLKPLQQLRIKQLIDDGFEAGALQSGKGLIFGNLKEIIR